MGLSTKPTKTIHIRQDIHRVLRQLAAHEDAKLEDVADRVLRHALDLPGPGAKTEQRDLLREGPELPAGLRR